MKSVQEIMESVSQAEMSEEASKTSKAIDAISRETWSGGDDFFKMAELIKGLAVAAKNGDKTAKSFLQSAGKSLAGLAKSGSVEEMVCEDKLELDVINPLRAVQINASDLVDQAKRAEYFMEKNAFKDQIPPGVVSDNGKVLKSGLAIEKLAKKNLKAFGVYPADKYGY